MNLKTHTAYPQVNVEEDYHFTVRFFDRVGKRVFGQRGQGSSDEEAGIMANNVVTTNADKFIRVEG